MLIMYVSLFLLGIIMYVDAILSSEWLAKKVCLGCDIVSQIFLMAPILVMFSVCSAETATLYATAFTLGIAMSCVLIKLRDWKLCRKKEELGRSP